MHFFQILLFFFLFCSSLESTVPVSYQGRIRPADAYAKLWLYDIYHRDSLRKEDLTSFQTDSVSALDFLWQLTIIGNKPYLDSPLFWVHSLEIKQLAHLELTRNRFSFNELYDPIYVFVQNNQTTNEEIVHLRTVLQQFKNINGNKSILKIIPSRLNDEWLPANSLENLNNFTLYSDADFHKIKEAYVKWKNSLTHNQSNAISKELYDHFAYQLEKGYEILGGQPYKRGHGKTLYYPTISQLKWESFYYQYPLINATLLFYGITVFVILLTFRFNSPLLNKISLTTLLCAFCLHTLILTLRIYILNRPPVSNMFETVIYVPWIAVAISLLLKTTIRPILLLASSIISFILLILIQINDISNQLDNVQPVLDSQFWLTIHVLMVVSSYGIFLLGGILGHFYLFSYLVAKKETNEMHKLGQCILQTLYIGTALLIAGTLLGGVWAAQSWGRFWDWDPKESWAFISIAIYIIWIHLYRFNKIKFFGLSFGAITGLIAITFTWYGVNYILGTGLHSYGFGSGGTKYYFSFLLAEFVFLTYSLSVRNWRQNLKI